jgi:transposase
MSSHLYWLDGASWLAIEPLLPRGRRGAHRVDDRRVISVIMHMLTTGARWRDCPPEYGPYTTIYNRLAAPPFGSTAGARRGFGRIFSTP